MSQENQSGEIVVINGDAISGRSLAWYQQWRMRVGGWVNDHSGETVGDIVMFVPDLFVLLVRLTQDRRVSFWVKAQLVLAAAYVLSPVDLIPEALAGVVGLADDAGVLALTLLWLRGIASLDPAVLQDNWSGKGDIHQIINTLHAKIVENADKLLGEGVWEKLSARFERRTATSDMSTSGDDKVRVVIS